MASTSNSAKKNLIVYKASAGSGKTFTLVSEYLALAIGRSLYFGSTTGKAATYFDKILAITFTNKATSEMKMRILNTLYNISHKQEAANAYIRKIVELTGGNFTDEDITKGAAAVLSNILHNYDRFDVKTIDSFYHNIVSNIAFMIGYHSNLEVYLEDNEAINEAVDNIVNGMVFGDDNKKEACLNLLSKYIDHHIEEESSWDFRRGMKKFGQNICKEIYMMNSEQINEFFKNGNNAKSYISKLRGLKRKYENTITMLADEFLKAMEINGVGFGDIKNGKNLEKYIIATRNNADTSKTKTGSNYSSSPEYWLFAKSRKQHNPETDSIIESTLFPIFKNLENSKKKLIYEINSIDLTLANINDLQMLSMIDEEVKRESKESNRILLSKSQELIRDEIKSTDDISFVFEQAGKRYRHIMLDEAQDTSRMQWENLRMFLLNIIANIDGRSIVVGDIKQSIYRWRNSDWTILANLDSKDGKNHFNNRIEINTLEHNYRSECNIVKFNNEFFKTAAKLTNDKAVKYCGNMKMPINSLYDDVVQLTNKKGGLGYIQIDCISQKNNDKDTAEDIRLEILAENIKELHAEGLPYSQMAILVRRNADLKSISDYAEEHNLPFKISTNEAYGITNARSVKIIIAAIKYINGYVTGSEDNISKTYLIREWQNINIQENVLSQGHYNEISTQSQNKEYKEFDYMAEEPTEQRLPERFIEEFDYLSRLPVYELCLELIDILGIEKLKEESAYIYTFIDYINNYSQKNSYDINKFIEDWETEAEKQKISATDIEGIRAMTIHSAKGLEFHTVFIPYCDWLFIPNNSGKLIWCSPTEEPIGELSLIPVDYKAKNAESIYAADYEKENYNIIIDNFNTLYVAFTRAKANLYLELVKPTETENLSSERISNTIVETIQDTDFCNNIKFTRKNFTNKDSEKYENAERQCFGEKNISYKTTNSNESEHFSMQGEPIEVPFQK